MEYHSKNNGNIYEHEIQFDRKSINNKEQPKFQNYSKTEFNNLNNNKYNEFNQNSQSEEQIFNESVQNSKQNIPNENILEDIIPSQDTIKTNFIKEYVSDVNLYGLSLQSNQNSVRVAVSSLETNSKNKIEIIEYFKKSNKIKKICYEETLFPQSKINWCPSSNNNSLLAGTSDSLRIYKFNELSGKIDLACDLNKKKKNSGPLTSMDWNKINCNLIGVCSVDTTCTIWDLAKQDIKTHLIAHDSEVFDINFGANENTFISTGADGSIRLFDLRALDTCSVLFESQDQTPINRIAWNMINSNYIAAAMQDRNIIYIIDARVLNSPFACLTYHTNLINGIAWAPGSWSHICTVGDDKNALIWDIQMIENRTEDPILSYRSENEIENCVWSEPHDNWIFINSGNIMKMLKVI